mgnify:CR=1 FL=1
MKSPIAIVDDSEDDRLIAKICYDRSQCDHPWIEFDSGDEFLAHLRTVKSGGVPLPALGLLDINMPGRSGFDVLKEIKADPFFNKLPVIVFLTNSSAEEDKKKAKKLGASSYTTKPTNLDDYVEFFNTLDEFLKK